MIELSDEELKERIALARRFRELLVAQRERFHDYLESLEKQKTIMEKGKDIQAIIAHVEMEEKMISDIFSIQKVITPFEAMYHSQKTRDRAEAELSAPDIPELQAALERLKTEAGAKAKQNMALLEKLMIEAREELKAFKNNPYKRNSASGGLASLLDMKG